MTETTSTFSVEKPKLWNRRDLYKDFVNKLLAENPDYWGRYSKTARQSNYWVYKKSGNSVVEVINYERWGQIMHAYFKHAKQAIINGQSLTIGPLGRLEPRMTERNHNNPKVDWGETAKQPKVLNDKGKLVPKVIIYFTDDAWLRIAWVKGKVQNILFYAFRPTANSKNKKGFAGEFAQANKDNPQLRYVYPYYPYRPKAKKE